MPLTSNDFEKLGKLIKASADSINARTDASIKASADSINARTDATVKASSKSINSRIDIDLKNMGDFVRASVDVVSARIDRLEENMNRRFDENTIQHEKLNSKIDLLTDRDEADIGAAYDDIDTIKTRLRKAGI